MTILVTILALLLMLPAFCSRAMVLAKTPAGAFFYYSNIVKEFLWKRLGFHRDVFDGVPFVVGLIVLTFAWPTAWIVSVLLAFALIVADLTIRIRERNMLTTVHAHADSRSYTAISVHSPDYIAGMYPRPCPHPELTVNFRGPFTARLPEYQLGHLLVGRRIALTVIVANHSVVSAQVPVKVTIEVPGGVEANPRVCEIAPLRSGDFEEVPIELRARSSGGPCNVVVTVTYADRAITNVIGIAGTFESSAPRIKSVQINRYPGACQAAFAWRGDMDHYDWPTFQSIEGLTNVLGLAARYRMPQTMYMSSRLCADLEATTEFYETLGVTRGQSEAPRFLEWFRENVELRHQIGYPFAFDKPYAMELGNHGHLHYGTDAAPSKENGWTFRVKMGAGKYPWVGSDTSSFGEQRDNAIRTRQIYEELFGFSPKSWAMPDSTNDEWTSRAMEAAGCQVLSDSDIKQKHNVLLQPPPHHPRECGAVEITKRFPGDPEHIYHVAMIKYWLHRAHRGKIPVVFMCHQHMRQFAGHGCTRFTEAVLHYTLNAFHGDLSINTVYGLGIYWNEVFSPKNRSVHVHLEEGEVLIRNEGDIDLVEVPLEITYENGTGATLLVDLPARTNWRVRPDGSGTSMGSTAEKQ